MQLLQLHAHLHNTRRMLQSTALLTLRRVSHQPTPASLPLLNARAHARCKPRLDAGERVAAVAGVTQLKYNTVQARGWALGCHVFGGLVETWRQWEIIYCWLMLWSDSSLSGTCSAAACVRQNRLCDCNIRLVVCCRRRADGFTTICESLEAIVIEPLAVLQGRCRCCRRRRYGAACTWFKFSRTQRHQRRISIRFAEGALPAPPHGPHKGTQHHARQNPSLRTGKLDAISSDEEAGVNQVGQQHADDDSCNYGRQQLRCRVRSALRCIGCALGCLRAAWAIARLRGA